MWACADGVLRLEMLFVVAPTGEAFTGVVCFAKRLG